MANTESAKPDLPEKIIFWITVHAAAITFKEQFDRLDREELELPELAVHDGLCIMHAISHEWMEELGVPDAVACDVDYDLADMVQSSLPLRLVRVE